MAGPAETSFNSLLHADSDFNLPDSYAVVDTALSAYCAIFKKGKTAKAVEERLDLLSRLLWLHVHANDMSSAISAASDGQQRRSSPKFCQGWQFCDVAGTLSKGWAPESLECNRWKRAREGPLCGWQQHHAGNPESTGCFGPSFRCTTSHGIV